MIFICLTNGFHYREMTFTCSPIDFYIQQIIFTFVKKFIYSAIWNLLSATGDLYSRIWDLRLRKWNLLNIYIQQTKPNFDVTKCTSKAFGKTKDLVCKLYNQSVSISSYFSNVLCTLQRWYLRTKFSVSFCGPSGL